MAKTYDLCMETQLAEYHLGFARVVISMEVMPISFLPPFSVLTIPYLLLGPGRRCAHKLVDCFRRVRRRLLDVCAWLHGCRLERQIDPHSRAIQRLQAVVKGVVMVGKWKRLVASEDRSDDEDVDEIASLTSVHNQVLANKLFASNKRLANKLAATAGSTTGTVTLRASVALRAKLDRDGYADDLTLEPSEQLKIRRSKEGLAAFFEELGEYLTMHSNASDEDGGGGDDQPMRKLALFQSEMTIQIRKLHEKLHEMQTAKSAHVQAAHEAVTNGKALQQEIDAKLDRLILEATSKPKLPSKKPPGYKRPTSGANGGLGTANLSANGGLPSDDDAAEQHAAAAHARGYYESLALTRSATLADVKKAYRKLALKHHPEGTGTGTGGSTSEAELAFSEISEAYDVLSNQARRAIYDQYGEKGLKEGVPDGQGGVKGGSKYCYHSNAVETFSTFFGTSSLADIRADIRASQSPPSKRELHARREVHNQQRSAASGAVSAAEGLPQYNTSGFMYSTSGGRPSTTMKPLQTKAGPPPPTNSPQPHLYEPIPKPLPTSKPPSKAKPPASKPPSKPPSSPAAGQAAHTRQSELHCHGERPAAAACAPSSSTARFHRSQLPTLPAAVPLPAARSERSSRSPSPDRSAISAHQSYSC